MIMGSVFDDHRRDAQGNHRGGFGKKLVFFDLNYIGTDFKIRDNPPPLPPNMWLRLTFDGAAAWIQYCGKRSTSNLSADEEKVLKPHPLSKRSSSAADFTNTASLTSATHEIFREVWTNHRCRWSWWGQRQKEAEECRWKYGDRALHKA